MRELEYVVQRGGIRQLQDERYWGLVTSLRRDLSGLDHAISKLSADLVARHRYKEALVSLLDASVEVVANRVLMPNDDVRVRDVADRLLGYRPGDELLVAGQDGKQRSALLRLIVNEHYPALKDAPVGSSLYSNHVRRISRNLRFELATAVLGLLDASERVKSDVFPQPTGQVSKKSGSVIRQQVLADLNKAVVSSVKPVSIWGPSGVGKSYAVREYLGPRYKADRYAIVRSGDSDEAVYRLDLVRLLSKCNLQPDNWSKERMEASLHTILSKGEQLDVVVFDDVPIATFERVVPRETRATVIIVGQTRIAGGKFNSVRIGDYTIVEAIEAARLHLPDSDATTLSVLCDRLGRRPLLIDIACRVVSLNGVSLKSLLEALQASATDALSQMQNVVDGVSSRSNIPSQRRFMAVFQAALDVARADPLAFAMLETITWLTGGAFEQQVVGLATPDKESGDLAPHAALLRLESLGIVELQDSFIAINDLTLQLLRELTRSSLNRIIAQYLRTFRARTEYRVLEHTHVEGGELRVQANLSTAAEMRSGASVTLAIIDSVLDDVRGNHNDGCQSLNANLVFWRSVDQDPHYRLISTGVDGEFVEWDSSGQVAVREELSPQDEQLFKISEIACNPAGRPWVRGGMDIDWYIARRGAGAPQKRRHVFVSSVSLAFARLYDIDVWSICGRLIESAQLTDDDLAVELCDDCLGRNVIWRVGMFQILFESLLSAVAQNRRGLANLKFYNALLALSPKALGDDEDMLLNTIGYSEVGVARTLFRTELMLTRLARSTVESSIRTGFELMLTEFEGLCSAEAMDSSPGGEVSAVRALAGAESLFRRFDRPELADRYSQWLAELIPEGIEIEGSPEVAEYIRALPPVQILAKGDGSRSFKVFVAVPPVEARRVQDWFELPFAEEAKEHRH